MGLNSFLTIDLPMVHMLWAVSPRIQNRTSLRKLEENGLGKVGAEGRAGAGPGGGSLWNLEFWNWYSS